MKEYQIITGRKELLRELIKCELAQGWELYEAPFITGNLIIPKGQHAISTQEVEFAQAMIKNKEREQ